MSERNSTMGAWRPRVAFVLEASRGAAQRSGLDRIGGALEEAGVEVIWHTLGAEQTHKDLQAQLGKERPDLLCATGVASLDLLQRPATRLGVPLLWYEWPAGPLPLGPPVAPPTRAVVSSPAARRALLRRVGASLQPERVHVLPPLLPQGIAAGLGPWVELGSQSSKSGSQPGSRPGSQPGIQPVQRPASQPGALRADGQQQGPGPAEVVVGVLGGLDDLERLPWVPGCRYELVQPPEADPLQGLAEVYRQRLGGLDIVLLLETLDPGAAPGLCAAALALGKPVLCENEAPLVIKWPAHLPGTHRRVLEVVRTADLDRHIETYADPRRGASPRRRLSESARNYASGALATQALQDHVELIFELLEERSPARFGKRLLRQAVAVVAARAPWRLGTRAIALAYHQVLPEVRGWDPNMIVATSTLERQVRALQHLGYTGVTMAQQAAQLLGDGPIPRDQPTFSISFDDGYLDTLEVAGPLLRGLGVPFTVYLITDLLAGRMQVPWYDLAAQAALSPAARSRALPVLLADGLLRPVVQGLPPSPALARAVVTQMKGWKPARRQSLIDDLLASAGEVLCASSPRYLDLQGARRLLALGAELSSHTRSHPILPLLNDEQLQDELAGSRAYLCEQFGQCPGLAYPNGDSDQRVRAAAAAAGYRYAVAVEPRRGAPRRYELGRRMISELSSVGLSRTFDESVFVARACGLLG